MDLFTAAILGIVEGLTEFLPVSSTGHLIVIGELLNFHGSTASTFEIFIQLGAILAVVIIYREIFLSFLKLNKKEEFGGLNGLQLLFLTTVPALIFGALAHGFIKRALFSSMTVAMGLGFGGVAILLIEQFLPASKKVGLNSLNWKDALLIGFFQCISLWPGMSRSACTILGAMLIGVDRKTAVEYSFLASVPVMFAATIFDLYKSFSILSLSDFFLFGVGFGFAFISAWVAIKFFIRIVINTTLKMSGWYRIFIALLLFFKLKF